MKKYIYLFRHGETFYNLGGSGKDKKFTGWKDAKLSPKGIKSAKIVAKKLKNVKFEIAFRSHLSRSKDTLKEVLKFHPECNKIITDDRMIERCYGSLQGFKHKTIIEKYGIEKFEKWHRSYDISPPKGESIKMVERRVNSFIKDLLQLIKKEKVNVAISAHGNSMRPFRKYFEKFNVKKMISLENPYDKYFRYSVNV
jgi:2,3-bisphosphoglycerate-dependent phosphoglycerate mutase